MDAFAIYAFVVTPALVLALGYALFLLDVRSFRKPHKRPGE